MNLVPGEKVAASTSPAPAGGTLTDEEVAARVLAGETGLFEVLMRRYIPVHHVTSIVVYLCSDAGSTISGQSLNVCDNIESLR